MNVHTLPNFFRGHVLSNINLNWSEQPSITRIEWEGCTGGWIGPTWSITPLVCDSLQLCITERLRVALCLYLACQKLAADLRVTIFDFSSLTAMQLDLLSLYLEETLGNSLRPVFIKQCVVVE